MTPWTFLAWLLLAVGYALLTGVLWLVGKVVGWPAWAVPAVSAGVVLLGLVFALVKWLVSRGENAESVTPGLPVVVPGMADMMPPRELAKRWGDFLPVLGREKKPVFIAVGDEDVMRGRLWRTSGNCRYVRDEASGLGLLIFPGCVWVDVPAKFVAPPKPDAGHPEPAVGAPGLWEELVAFLPRLPGAVRGVLVLAGPEAGEPRWLAEKIHLLYRKMRRTPPVLWLASLRLDERPGGARLIRKLDEGGGDDRAQLGAPFGVLAEVGVSVRPNRATAEKMTEELAGKIELFIQSCDGGGRSEKLDGSAHLLRRNMPDIVAGPVALAAALGEGAAARSDFGGILLAGKWDERLAFASSLAEQVIPSHSRFRAKNFRRRLMEVAGAAVFLFLAGGLGWLFIQGRQFIVDIPFHLLDASPNPGGFGGPPPVERYARARNAITRLENAAPVARVVFAAPNRGMAEAERRFCVNLESWLPTADQPALTRAWVEGLGEWVDEQPGIKPLVFSTSGGRELVRLSGSNGKKGRERAARLLAAWGELLNALPGEKVALLQDGYDLRVFDEWESGGKKLMRRLQGAARGGEEECLDLLASDPATGYVLAAGRELDYSSRARSDWVTAARQTGRVEAAALLLGGSEMTLSGLWSAARAAAGVLREQNPGQAADTYLSAGRKWKAYRESVAALEPRFGEMAGLSALATIAYSQEKPDPPLPSLADADMAWSGLERSLKELEPVFSNRSGKDFLALLSSRHHLAFAAGVVQAGREVSRSWEEVVLTPLVDMDADEQLVALVETRPLDAFLKGTVASFLRVEPTGLRPAQSMGMPFPFAPRTLSWLNRTLPDLEKLRKTYPVTLTLLPVTVDTGAKVFPRGQTFRMTTEKEPLEVTGYNYKTGMSFDWSLETAGDVELDILFDSFVFSVKYPGRLALPAFLANAAGGAIAVPVADYPQYSERLAGCGVNVITAHLLISTLSSPPPQSVTSPPESVMLFP